MVKNADWDRFTLRIPPYLHIELKVMAARSRRSLNSQVVAILEKAVTATEGAKFGDKTLSVASSNNAALAGGVSINR